MSNNSSNDFFGWVVVIGIAVIGIMWLCDAGPFEPSTPSYPTNYSSPGGAYHPSFGGGSEKSDYNYTTTAFYYNGSPVGQIEVYDNYIRVKSSGYKARYYSTAGTGNTSFSYFAYGPDGASYYFN